MPYVPGIGQKLQKIVRKYEFESWFTFPGKISQLFTRHRGREHPSKTQNAIYCAQCTCGIQYIGESSRNLKVRLNEHHFGSSISSLSIHMHDTGHKPTMHDTIILAKERNGLKCKVIESFCIENKCTKLCNTGVSMDIPAIWNLCSEELLRQLMDTD